MYQIEMHQVSDDFVSCWRSALTHLETRAEASMSDKEKFLDCVNDTSSCFKDNGALTLRFGNLLTGSNVGNYLLGVGYPSMEAIEKTYDELSANSSYKKLMTFAKVNMRNIIKIL